jgi:hypothetical protein
MQLSNAKYKGMSEYFLCRITKDVMKHDVHFKGKISRRKTAELGATDKITEMLTLESYLRSQYLTFRRQI